MGLAESPELPIIFFPGLNGDPRVFKPQMEAIPSLVVPSWTPAAPSESLPEYAKRLARLNDPGKPCIVGGVSFGGIVALEAARHLRANACVIIASARDVAGLPQSIRLLRPVAAYLPNKMMEWSIHSGWHSAAASEPSIRRRARRMTSDEKAFRRWAIKALLTWKPREGPPCPLFQIHGTRDHDFPAGSRTADRVVLNAGHMLTLTHAAEVNAYLREVIELTAA